MIQLGKEYRTSASKATLVIIRTHITTILTKHEKAKEVDMSVVALKGR